MSDMEETEGVEQSMYAPGETFDLNTCEVEVADNAQMRFEDEDAASVNANGNMFNGLSSYPMDLAYLSVLSTSPENSPHLRQNDWAMNTGFGDYAQLYMPRWCSAMLLSIGIPHFMGAPPRTGPVVYTGCKASSHREPPAMDCSQHSVPLGAFLLLRTSLLSITVLCTRRHSALPPPQRPTPSHFVCVSPSCFFLCRFRSYFFLHVFKVGVFSSF